MSHMMSCKGFEDVSRLKLLELVGDILESQQKVLIFTQYLGTLQLLQEILQASFANLRRHPR